MTQPPPAPSVEFKLDPDLARSIYRDRLKHLSASRAAVVREERDVVLTGRQLGLSWDVLAKDLHANRETLRRHYGGDRGARDGA